MTLTIAPADEACTALVNQINAGTTYALAVNANYSRTEIDRLEEIDGLRVDVVAMTETQPNELLDSSDNSRHSIDIVVRYKIQNKANDVSMMALLVRQIALSVSTFKTADGRVQVWEWEPDEKENPDKKLLNDVGLFFSSIHLQVEVQQ
ncbi:MAG: hypothetical protein WCH39_01615 [Schlesneria sp.]